MCFVSFREVHGEGQGDRGSGLHQRMGVPDDKVRSAEVSRIGTFVVVVEVVRRLSGRRLLDVARSSRWTSLDSSSGRGRWSRC